MAAELVVLAGVPDEEFAPSTENLRALQSSCLGNSLSQLTQPQKSQLRTILGGLRTEVNEAVDILRAQQIRVTATARRLQTEIDRLGDSSRQFSNFYSLMSSTIASCPEAGDAAVQIKSSTDRVTQQATELNYRKSLALIQSGSLLIEIDQAQKTLFTLDNVNLSLG